VEMARQQIADRVKLYDRLAAVEPKTGSNGADK
jgi:hypothetical protein